MSLHSTFSALSINGYQAPSNKNQSAYINPTLQGDARFGATMALANTNNDYMIIGAPSYYFPTFSALGRAIVYKKTGTSWGQVALVQPSGTLIGFRIGTTVAINDTGDVAFAGVPGYNVSGAAGAISWSTRSGSTWTQQAEFKPTTPIANSGFGNYMVTNTDGTQILVTAPYANSNAGLVYYFTRSGTTITQQSSFIGSDTTTNSYFGTNIAMNSAGDYLAVASSGLEKVYIFTRSGTTWTQQSTITAPPSSIGFGDSLSINAAGNILVVGDPLDDTYGSDAGIAYVYTRSGSTWSLQQTITPDISEASGYFGESVSINATGDQIVIGAYGTGAYGAAYQFIYESGAWRLISQYLPAPISSNAQYGDSILISQDSSIVAVGATDQQTYGAVYIFNN